MERDTDYLRNLMIIIMQQRPDFSYTSFSHKHYYHMYLLESSGYISIKQKYNLSSKSLGNSIFRYEEIKITPEGHQFISSISNNTVWEFTKEKSKEIFSRLAHVPLEILLLVAKQYIASQFGLTLSEG